MDSVIHSGTRRKSIHGGSGTASMLSTVLEQMPDSIFIALGECGSEYYFFKAGNL